MPLPKNVCIDPSFFLKCSAFQMFAGILSAHPCYPFSHVLFALRPLGFTYVKSDFQSPEPWDKTFLIFIARGVCDALCDNPSKQTEMILRHMKGVIKQSTECLPCSLEEMAATSLEVIWIWGNWTSHCARIPRPSQACLQTNHSGIKDPDYCLFSSPSSLPPFLPSLPTRIVQWSESDCLAEMGAKESCDQR